MDRTDVKTKEDATKYARERYIQEIDRLKRLEKLDIEEAERSEDWREPLAITQRTEHIVELSTGGDADGYKLYQDSNGDFVSGCYYWADWGVYEEVSLTDEEVDNIAKAFYLE